MRQKSVIVIVVLMISCAVNSFAGSWKSASWGGGGIFTAIQSNPLNQGVVWALSMHAGVLKSEDFGTTWKLANGDLNSLETVALLPDPENVQGAYLAKSLGLWHTADGGNHWDILHGTEGFHFTRFVSYKPVFVSASGGIIVVGTDSGGLFISKDRGKNWNEIKWGNIIPIRVIAGIPYKNLILVALSKSGGLYVFNPRRNDGPRFITSSPTFPVSDIVADPVYPNSILAVCGQHGLWTSTKHGKNWERTFIDNVDDDENLFYIAMCGSKDDRAFFICCKEFCLKSSDGRKWKRFLEKVYYDPSINPVRKWFARKSIPTCFSGGPSPDYLFLSDYMGLYRTTNSSGNGVWSEIVNGACNQVINDLAFDDNHNLFIAADRSGLVVTSDFGMSYSSVWPEKYGSQAGEFAAVALGKDNALVTTSLGKWDGHVAVYHGNSRIKKIFDRAAGVNGGKLILQISPFYSGPWALASSSLEKGLFYLIVNSTNPRLYITRDQGAEWTREDLPKGVFPGRSIAVDRTRSGYVYFGNRGSKGCVWRSRNYGRIWQKVLNIQEEVADLAVGSKGMIYILGGGGTVWRSSTHGIDWEKMGNTGLPPATALCVDPSDDSTIYVGSGGNILVSNDRGVSWPKKISPFLKLCQISCIAKDPGCKDLFVGTYGSGVWRVDLSE